MKFIDLFSIISGLASIISLALTMGERFAAWRKFIFPVSYGLAGFTAGRVSASFSASVTPTATESYPSGVLVVFIAVLVVISLATFQLLKRNEAWLAYMILFMGLSSTVPQIMKSFSESSSHIPVSDMLLLAADKERLSDWSGAITYLEKAAESSRDEATKKQIQDKVKIVQQKLTDSVLRTSATPLPPPSP